MIYEFTYVTTHIGGIEAYRRKKKIKLSDGSTFLQMWGTFNTWVYERYPFDINTVVAVQEVVDGRKLDVDFRALVPADDVDYPKKPDKLDTYGAIKDFLGRKTGDYPYVPCPTCRAPVTFHVYKRRTDNGKRYPVKGSCKYCHTSYSFEMS